MMSKQAHTVIVASQWLMVSLQAAEGSSGPKSENSVHKGTATFLAVTPCSAIRGYDLLLHLCGALKRKWPLKK